MFGYKEIIGKIKSSGYPYYRLKGRVDSYSNDVVVVGDNLNDKDSTNESLLESLDIEVKTCIKGNPQFIFELELLKTISSNQGGRLGIFKFIVEKDVTPVKTKEALPDQNFSGLGQVQDHIKAVSQMQSDLFQPRLDLQSEKNELMYDRKELARERKEFEKFKSEKEAEIKELETRFNKKSEIAKDGAEKAIWNILEKLTGKDESGLGGTAEIGEETEATPEEKMIESIALNILEQQEKGDIDLTDIKTIGAFVQKKINELKSK